MPSIEDVLTELYYPFEDIAPYMTAQVCDIINRRFKGDGSRFMLDFLLPCRELLLHLKEESWVRFLLSYYRPDFVFMFKKMVNEDQWFLYLFVKWVGRNIVCLELEGC